MSRNRKDVQHTLFGLLSSKVRLSLFLGIPWPIPCGYGSWFYFKKIGGLTTRGITWNRFPVSKLLIDSNSLPVRTLVTWIHICASFHHRKKMKAEPIRLNLRKLTANVKLLIVLIKYVSFFGEQLFQVAFIQIVTKVWRVIVQWDHAARSCQVGNVASC